MWSCPVQGLLMAQSYLNFPWMLHPHRPSWAGRLMCAQARAPPLTHQHLHLPVGCSAHVLTHGNQSLSKTPTEPTELEVCRQAHTHMDGCGEAGPGNGRRGAEGSRNTTGGTCTGGPALAPWHECAQGAAVAMDTAYTPPLASLSGLQPELRFGISLGPGPKCQEMSPHPFPAWQEPLGAARPVLVAGPSGIAPRENGQAQTCCTREQAWGQGGGSYTIPSGLGKAGGLKGPWQLPSPLYPGKETTA